MTDKAQNEKEDGYAVDLQRGVSLDAEQIERFAKINNRMDKDCPLHDCDYYNAELRGGCFTGTKRKNCWAYRKTN